MRIGTIQSALDITTAVTIVFIAATPCMSQFYPGHPGYLNPNVQQDNIQQTICRPGWTRTVRPGVEYTRKLKTQQIRELHLRGAAGEYEEDHVIPLALGGHPTDPRNLRPEPWAAAKEKDRAETRLHRMVCRGDITLVQAQIEIRSLAKMEEMKMALQPDVQPDRGKVTHKEKSGGRGRK